MISALSILIIGLEHEKENEQEAPPPELSARYGVE